jgi:hypothetical protein
MFKAFLLFMVLIQIACSTHQKSITSQKSAYLSKSKIFEIIFPEDLSPDFHIKEENSSLQVYDDFGNYYRLDYLELKPNELEEIENLKWSEAGFLAYMSEKRFFEDSILPTFPNSSITSRNSFKNHLGFNLFMVLYLPKGSSFLINGKRENIHRGITTFRVKNYIFMAHTQEKIELMSESKKKNLNSLEKDLLQKSTEFLNKLKVF